MITKEIADSYYIRTQDGWDWARIFIQEGKRNENTVWGYISVISSYGNFGYCFGHVAGDSFKKFLTECGVDYLMQKMTDGKNTVFDKDASVENVRNMIKEHVEKESLEEVLDTLSEIEESEDTRDGFERALSEELSEIWDELNLWESCSLEKICPQVDGFVKNIWGEFCSEIKKELSIS